MELKFNRTVASTAEQAFFHQVFGWMGTGLLIAAVIAWWGVGLVATIPPILYLFVFGGQLFMVWKLSAHIDRMSLNRASTMFIGFAALTGFSLSGIFVVYTPASIVSTFLVTALMFGAMAAYGYFTRRDLTGLGSFMFMGLIGIIIASLVNFIIGSTMLELVISIIGVLVFTGLTAYDVQRITHVYRSNSLSSDGLGRLAILGALTLFLDFVNLFIMLLRLFGNRE